MTTPGEDPPGLSTYLMVVGPVSLNALALGVKLATTKSTKNTSVL